ncbi:MAG: hypothetical protein FWD23_00025 [Oscillospiraceae bacterium]|nr:hypothetical protein [Oscillospiraceae bacterium]
MSFENLMLVARNYIKHGFENIILSDIRDERILTRDNGNTYRDWEQAIIINGRIKSREPLPNEYRIRVDNQNAEQVRAQTVSFILNQIH